MRRSICVAFALVAIFFAFPAAGFAAAAPTPTSLPTYAYDVVLGCQDSEYSVIQRAPPSEHPDIHVSAGQPADEHRSSGTLACSDSAVAPSIYGYDASAQQESTVGNVQGADGQLSSLNSGRVAAKSGIAANQLAGNAARDALAAAHPGSLIEQSFSTTAGVRRLDVLTQGGLGIESKVGRTSLTTATRSQIAKDSLLLGKRDVTGIEWVFSRSGVTGQMGPTGPLADALGKAGIPWSLAP